MPTIEVTLPNGEKKSFDESEFERIRFGRDESWADIVLDEALREKGVGNEHCELVASAGCYTLQTDGKHHVWIDGKVGYDEDPIPRTCSLSFIKDSTEATFHLVTTFAGGGATEEIEPPPRPRDYWQRRGIVAALVMLIAAVTYLSITPPSLNENDIEAIQERVFSVQETVANTTIHAGTAWLAADNIVVTNRHVAKLVQKSLDDQANGIGDGPFIRFRSKNNQNGDTKAIKGVIFHPADSTYNNFLNQRPVRPESDFTLYDVAILELEGEAIDLSPLELASEKEFKVVENGDSLIIVGFPLSKGIIEWDFNKPIAEVRRGTFDKTRNAFSGEGIKEVNPLLSYDIKTAGGSSGSPVINEKGKVIAIHFAGTKVLINDQRVDGGNSYGQNIRLVRQLVDGSIFKPEILKQEEKVWQQWLSTTKSIEQESVYNQSKNTSYKFQCVYNKTQSWQALSPNSSSQRVNARNEYTLPVVGEYLVFIQSLDPTGVKIGVTAYTDAGSYSHYGSKHHYEFATETQSENETLSVSLNGPNSEADYTLNIYAWSDTACDSNGFESRK